MTSSAESPLEAVCPYCRGKIRLPSDPAVDRVRCPRCNENVPLVLLEARASSSPQSMNQATASAAAPAATPAVAPQPPAPPRPPEVRVKCRLCGTLIYRPLSEVGKEVKCPDCDFMNVVPEPPKPQKKVELRLDDADSFGLVEGVDQPDKQSASMQQKWYMAKCPTCFTQIRLTVDHAGKQIKCPDCLTPFTAGEPPPEPKKQAKIEDSDDYELKLSEPVDRPPIDVEDLIASREVPHGEELRAASMRGELNTREKLTSLHAIVKGEKPKSALSSSDDALDVPLAPLPMPPAPPPAAETTQSPAKSVPGKAKQEPAPAAKRDGETSSREIPPPEVPSAGDQPPAPKRRRFRVSATTQFLKKLLLTGLRTFTSDQGLILRWLVLALLIAATLYVGASTVSNMQKDLDPMGSFMTLLQAMLASLMLLFSVIVTANTFLPIVISASMEQEYVEDWPPFVVTEWFMQMFYIINAVTVGAMPNILVIPFYSYLSLPVLAVLQWLTIVPLFPIAILSMLDEGSAFAPYAPSFWRLISVQRGLWYRFTAVGYVMAGIGMLFAGFTLYSQSAIMAVISGLAIASLIVLYGRFLGRMAMFMSQQSEIKESLDEAED